MARELSFVYRLSDDADDLTDRKPSSESGAL